MKRKTATEPATERLSLSFQLVRDAINLAPNEFEGYASVFESPVAAWMPTKVMPGAFRKTLQERGGRIKVLWQHDPDEPIGVPVMMQETSKGLHVRARISETDTGKKALTLIRDGVIDSLSIGFDPVKEEIVENDKGETWRHLKEVRLYEFSLVTFPADEAAAISAIHSVVPFQDLPLADQARPWSRNEAEYRVRDWAGGANSLEDMNWSKYRQAFSWYDGDSPQEVGSYKLQIGDIIEGTLTAVPRAVYACAVVLQGGRGGVAIPESEKAGVKAHIGRYYKKMDRTPPWESEADELAVMLEEWAASEEQAFEIQSLVFPKDKWDSAEAAKKWAADHDFKSDGMDETGSSYRFRQRDPDDFLRLRTICINPGRNASTDECKVKAVGGPLKESASLALGIDLLARVPREAHVGKVLSAKSKALIKNAIEALENLLAAAEPPEPEEEDSLALTDTERLNQLREAELALAQTLNRYQ